MPRTCVFCGGSPTTREHVWPSWAARLVRDAGPVTHATRLERQGQEPVERVWLQDPFSMTVNVVCRSCNNGWMALIEERAQPLLWTMLHGRGRALHQGGQRDLATWALKTALMAQYTTSAGDRVFPAEVHDFLYERGEPPMAMRIWMANYTGSNPGVLHLYGLDLDDEQDAHRNRRDIYGATLGLGPVIFQICGTGNQMLLDSIHGWPWSNVWDIWPHRGKSFTWTPRSAFADRELLAFADEIPATLMRLSEQARRDADQGHLG